MEKFTMCLFYLYESNLANKHFRLIASHIVWSVSIFYQVHSLIQLPFKIIKII